MKQAGTRKSLRESQKEAKTAKIGNKTTIIYEGNFITNAAAKAKEFLKTSISNLKKKAKSFVKELKKDFLGSKSPKNFQAGKMIAFQYKAKDATKKFDKSPLVISLGYSQNPKHSKSHFFGLNLHWLPMKDRVSVASFFTELNKKRGGKLTYSDVKPFLKKFRGYPVVRQYIIKNVSNKVIEMPADQFMGAASVPTEQWSK